MPSFSTTGFSLPAAGPFQPERLQAALRPVLSSDESGQGLQAYRAFYGLPDTFEHRLGRLSVGGYELAAQLWLPEKPRATLILLHGYYDHLGLYGHLLRWALEMGFAVLGCDLPGHGLSSGARASIGEFAEYQTVLDGLFIQAAELQLPAPWHLAGQSTGGAILLDYLLTGAPRPEEGQALLFAPLVRPRAWHWSLLSYRLMRPFAESIPRRFYANSHDAEFIDFVQNRDPLQPQHLPTAWVGALSRWIPHIEAAPRSARKPLVVQGQGDMTVDWRHNLSVLQAKFDQPELIILPEARHHLVNERADLRRYYFDRLSQRLS